jgi:hypothetical protein
MYAFDTRVACQHPELVRLRCQRRTREETASDCSACAIIGSLLDEHHPASLAHVLAHRSAATVAHARLGTDHLCAQRRRAITRIEPNAVVSACARASPYTGDVTRRRRVKLCKACRQHYRAHCYSEHANNTINTPDINNDHRSPRSARASSARTTNAHATFTVYASGQ